MSSLPAHKYSRARVDRFASTYLEYSLPVIMQSRYAADSFASFLASREVDHPSCNWGTLDTLFMALYTDASIARGQKTALLLHELGVQLRRTHKQVIQWSEQLQRLLM